MYGLHLGRIGTPELSWRRYAVLLRQLGPTSRYGKAVIAAAPEELDTPTTTKLDCSKWPLPEQLLAMMIDHLAIANWQRTGKSSNKPKPMYQVRKQSGQAKPAMSQDEVRSALAAITPGLNA